MTSLALTRQFQVDWLKVSFLGEAELHLGEVVSVGLLTVLAQVTPFLICCCFLTVLFPTRRFVSHYHFKEICLPL